MRAPRLTSQKSIVPESPHLLQIRAIRFDFCGRAFRVVLASHLWDSRSGDRLGVRIIPQIAVKRRSEPCIPCCVNAQSLPVRLVALWQRDLVCGGPGGASGRPKGKRVAPRAARFLFLLSAQQRANEQAVQSCSTGQLSSVAEPQLPNLFRLLGHGFASACRSCIRCLGRRRRIR